MDAMTGRMIRCNETTTIEVKPSALGLTLNWWSFGPEFVASIWTNGVIQGVGFGPTEEAAIAEARADVAVLAAS